MATNPAPRPKKSTVQTASSSGRSSLASSSASVATTAAAAPRAIRRRQDIIGEILQEDEAAVKVSKRAPLPFAGETFRLLRQSRRRNAPIDALLLVSQYRLRFRPPRGLQEFPDATFTDIYTFVKEHNPANYDEIDSLYDRLESQFTILYPDSYRLHFYLAILRLRNTDEWKVEVTEWGGALSASAPTLFQVPTDTDVEALLERQEASARERDRLLAILETYTVSTLPCPFSEPTITAALNQAVVRTPLSLRDFWSRVRIGVDVPLSAYKTTSSQLFTNTYRGLNIDDRTAVNALARQKWLSDMAPNSVLLVLKPNGVPLRSARPEQYILLTLSYTAEQPDGRYEAESNEGDPTPFPDALDGTTPIARQLIAQYNLRRREIDDLIRSQNLPLIFAEATSTTVSAYFDVYLQYLDPLSMLRYGLLQSLGRNFYAFSEEDGILAIRSTDPLFLYREPWVFAVGENDELDISAVLPQGSELAPEIKVIMRNRDVSVPADYVIGTPAVRFTVSDADTLHAVRQFAIYISHIMRETELRLRNVGIVSASSARLTAAYPNVFPPGYSKFCSIQSQPVLISREEAIEARADGIDVLEFQLHGEDTDTIFLASDNEARPYVALKENKGPNRVDNFDIYPLLPCCRAREQKRAPASTNISLREANATLLKRNHALKPNSNGPLDENLLGWLRGIEPRRYMRRGVTPNDRTLESILSALNFACNENYTRRNLRDLKASVVKGTMWDYTDKEIRQIWYDGYLDPRLHVRAMMILYNVNIIMVDSNGIVRPRARYDVNVPVVARGDGYPVYDWLLDKDGIPMQVVLLYLNDRGPPELQCEVIYDTDAKEYPALFDNSLPFLQAYAQLVRIERPAGPAPMIALSSWLNLLPGARIVAQYLDDYGLARAFAVQSIAGLRWLWCEEPTSSTNVSIGTPEWKIVDDAWLASISITLPAAKDGDAVRLWTIDRLPPKHQANRPFDGQVLLLPATELTDAIAERYGLLALRNDALAQRQTIARQAEIVFSLLEWAYQHLTPNDPARFMNQYVLRPTAGTPVEYVFNTLVDFPPEPVSATQVFAFLRASVTGLVVNGKFVTPTNYFYEAFDYYLFMVVYNNPVPITELPIATSAASNVNAYLNQDELQQAIEHTQAPIVNFSDDHIWLSRVFSTQLEAEEAGREWLRDRYPNLRNPRVRVLTPTDTLPAEITEILVKQEGTVWVALLPL